MSTERREIGNERLANLLTAARQGDRESLNAIVREVTPLLWHVARAQGLDRESSADVVQTTWLTLMTSMSGIQAPGALVGWLVTVTKREAWRTHRAQQGEHAAGLSISDNPDPAPGPDDHAVVSDRNTRLWAALDQLSERCRQLLRIVAFTHRPDYNEIAAEMGMRRGSVGPNRGRCLTQLRHLLGEGER
jgi:RNA polymerase sigma factor (sigma-70 family)